MKENDAIIIMIVFTSFTLVMGFSFFLMFNRYHNRLRSRQKEALNNLIIGQDNERERLARDLHDQMGAELSSIIFILDEIKSQEPEVMEKKQKAKTNLRDAISGIRQLSHDLMPVTLSKYGLFEALQELQTKYEGVFNIEIQSNIENERLNSIIESHLFKIINELIYNTQKHAQADSIRISLHLNRKDKILHFTYQDNGKSIKDAKDKNDGIGIKNMTTRVGLLNGKIVIERNQGFKTSIILPIEL
jgi:signal transduction histidine kinase